VSDNDQTYSTYICRSNWLYTLGIVSCPNKSFQMMKLSGIFNVSHDQLWIINCVMFGAWRGVYLSHCMMKMYKVKFCKSQTCMHFATQVMMTYISYIKSKTHWCTSLTGMSALPDIICTLTLLQNTRFAFYIQVH